MSCERLNLKAIIIFGLIAGVYMHAVRVARAQSMPVVTGRVLYPTGEPAVSAEVMLVSAAGATQAQLVDADGRFHLAAAPGAYRLNATIAGVATATRMITLADAETVLEIEVQYIDEVIEISERYRTQGEQLQESARAVQVIDTKEAKRKTADLGEVLARSQGVGVRRSGGLGSGTRFSLAGLTDEQIRFFLDGVPLDLAGYPFGLANVPVNLVERAEVYRGVVPIRFGADALGGAVNLVSDDDVRPSHRSISYQSGSFGTHRVTMGATQRHDPTGLFVRFGGFFDRATNNYGIDVMVPSRDPETRGQSVPARVGRFHDGYQAAGGSVELGIAKQPWADRLGVRAFASGFSRDLQSNPTMTTPYGDARYDKTATGGMARYQHRARADVPIDVVAGFAHSRVDFLDVGTCIYDWFGECVRMRQGVGEMDEGNPRDDTLWENAAYLRLVVGWDITARHGVRASIAPTYVARHGKERLGSDDNNYGAVSAERDLSTLVSGLEYEVDLIDERLENIAFVKAYTQWIESTAGVAGTFADRTLARDTMSFGGGDSLRYRFVDWLYAKASYEYATRLPSADEVFGDAVLTNENLELHPEISHNANLGVTLDLRETRSGTWRGEVNGFVRDADNLIVLLTAYGQRFRNENVFAARSIGVEANAGWTSPGELVVLDSNFTYQDFRNLRAEGLFAEFGGDRIPNRPYLFANAAAQFQLAHVATSRDRLSLGWHTRYVHTFFQFWESAGTRDSKLMIPSQLLHSIAVSYVVGRDRILTFTGELSNVTDERAFDFYGAQRPGRAVFFKSTAEF